MIILIAESKTMVEHQTEFPEAYLSSHTPVDEAIADETMARVSEMSAGEIAGLTGFSSTMAARLRRMAYEFPNKRVGVKAVEAFTGVVFRNFEYAAFGHDTREDVNARLRIVSSLYGWLRPDDVIKPYRMDYTTKLGPDGEPMWKLLRGKVTARLVEELTARGRRYVLDLLPGDAMKCIDISRVGEGVKFLKVDFREVDGSKVRSPHATKLKAMRGRLLQAVFIHGLDTPEKIASYSDERMMGSGEVSDNGVITFFV